VKTSWFAALVNAPIDIPDDLARELRALYRRNPEQLREPALPWLSRGGPASVDSPADNAILLRIFGRLSLRPGVGYHSLIGAHGKEGDGVVSPQSAHVERTESEHLFEADHRDIGGAAVTAEIVRVRRTHLNHASG